MEKKITITLLIFFSIITMLKAQDINPLKEKKWLIEFNALVPIYPGNIYEFKIGRKLWQKGDLKGEIFLGYHMRPEEFRDTEGYFTDNAIVISYRQYLWKGFNLETYNLLSSGSLKNHVSTKKNYDSSDLLNAGFVGYNVELGKQKRIYINTQLGYGLVIYKSNPWPIYEDNTLQKEVGETAFLKGGVQIGFKF